MELLAACYFPQQFIETKHRTFYLKESECCSYIKKLDRIVTPVEW